MIDSLLILLGFLCVCSGIRNGLLAEIFRFFGAFVATIVTVHYYIIAAEPIAQRLGISLTKTEVFTFIVLWLGVLVAFWFLRRMVLSFYNKDDRVKFECFLAAILAAGRAYLLGGLFILLLFVSENSSFIQQARNAYLYPYFRQVSPIVYQGAYNGFISKVFPNSRKNVKVFSLQYK